MRRLRHVVAAVGVLFAVAVPAYAHVTVDPESVPKGTGDVVLSFRVPNEETTDTVKIDMQLPQDHPIAVVDVRPTDGWTAQVTTTHLATPITTDDGTFTDVASEIVWTGGKIAPGDFETFELLAQGIPDSADSLKFPTIQTYANGDTVSWIQDAPPGGPEPDHPAPVLTLTAAQDQGSTSSTSSSSASGTAAAPTQTTVKKETSNGLAIAALIVAIVALVVAIVMGITRRKTDQQPSE